MTDTILDDRKLVQYIKPHSIRNVKSIELYEEQINKKVKDFTTEDWSYVCKYVYLTELFMMKHQALLHWRSISKHRRLSNRFISMYAHKLDWDLITEHQNMSEKFMLEHADKINWEYILNNRTLSHRTLVLLVGHNFKHERTKQQYIIQMRRASQKKD